MNWQKAIEENLYKVFYLEYVKMEIRIHKKKRIKTSRKNYFEKTFRLKN